MISYSCRIMYWQMISYSPPPPHTGRQSAKQEGTEQRPKHWKMISYSQKIRYWQMIGLSLQEKGTGR